MTIRNAVVSDQDQVLKIALESGIFDESGLEMIKQSFLESGEAIWLVAEENNELIGVSYTIPEAMTVSTWNILMLLVKASTQGKGVGKQLMQGAESRVKTEGGTLCIVETSSSEGFETARQFYPKCGFIEEARIKNFYSMDDDKIIFTKLIV
jgi:GNAT superfamily N-acetyltransferase